MFVKIVERMSGRVVGIDGVIVHEDDGTPKYKETTYDCRRFTIEPCGPDSVIVSMTSENGIDERGELKKNGSRIYLMNDQGQTVDIHRWN